MNFVGRPTSAALLAANIRDAAASSAGRFIVGIAGPPGAGKSTLAQLIRDALNAESHSAPIAEIAPMDGFHLTNAALIERGALLRKGEPDTFDVDGYAERLRRLRDSPIGESVPWPTYDRALHDPTPAGVEFREQSIAITEGNYLLSDDVGSAHWSGLRKFLDEAWYLDAPVEVIERRLYERQLRGGKSPADAAAKVRDSDLLNAEFIAKTKDRATLTLREIDGEYYIVGR